MQRLFPAVVAALFFHLLFFLLPARHPVDTPPQITGEDTIRIRLTAPPASIQKKQELQQSPVPPTPQPATASSPVQTLPQKNVDPVVIRVKKQKHRLQPMEKKPAEVVASPDSRATPPEQAVSIATPASPAAIVKAKPMYHRNPKPAYPSIARRRNWQGTTILLVRVSINGEAREVSIHKGSGYEMLDKSALSSVRQWHFLPATENGRAVAMDVLVPVHFRLQ